MKKQNKQSSKVLSSVEEVVDQYQISHKGNIQCKCISGARGHLIVKLNDQLTRHGRNEYERGLRHGQIKAWKEATEQIKSSK